jgi:hypothetical protein
MQEARRVQDSFARNNPGYTLNASPPRSLARQVQLWAASSSVKTRASSCLGQRLSTLPIRSSIGLRRWRRYGPRRSGFIPGAVPGRHRAQVVSADLSNAAPWPSHRVRHRTPSITIWTTFAERYHRIHCREHRPMADAPPVFCSGQGRSASHREAQISTMETHCDSAARSLMMIPAWALGHAFLRSTCPDTDCFQRPSVTALPSSVGARCRISPTAGRDVVHAD